MTKISGNKLNKILNINAKHALYRQDGKWYHNLKLFPGVLFDENGYIIFEKESDYLNNSSLQIKKDLHIKNGIKSIKGYKLFDEAEKKYLLINKTKSIPEEVIWKMRLIELRNRNQTFVDEIKQLYNNTCQICGIQIKLTNNTYYSEVHHIKPLGKKHLGPDTLNNMICVCPNDHAILDLKYIHLSLENLKILKHDISKEYIAYHNSIMLS